MRRLLALVALCLLGCTSDPKPTPEHRPNAEGGLLKTVPQVTDDARLIAEALEAAKEPPETISPEEASFAAERIDKMLFLNVEVKGANGEPLQKCGSAVIVSKDGTALTALHVVKDATSVRAWTLKWAPDGREGSHPYEKVREIPMTVVRVAERADAALIRPTVSQQMPSPARVQRMLPGKDQKVYHFGITSDVADGIVLNPHSTSMVPNAVVREVIEVQTATNPGDSGGPLLNEEGDVLGICLAFSTNKRGFFLPVRTALESLHYSPRR